MARWRSGNAQACKAFSEGSIPSRAPGEREKATARSAVAVFRGSAQDGVRLPSYVQLSTLGETLLEHDHEERALYDHDNNAASTAY